MNAAKQSWTSVHDLALIYISLAYGTDCELVNAELDALTERLREWHPDATDADVDQIVLEAMAVYLEEDTEQEVARAISTLSESLSKDERRRALHDVIRIAEADGLLLNTEQSLISTLADAWDVKGTEERLLDQTHVEVEEVPSWSLLHDLGLIYLVVAHSTDDNLSKPEIDVMITRLSEWQPDLTEEEIREVLRTALNFYSQGVDEPVLRQSVEGIRNAFSVIQRLVILDDLNQIACADGKVLETEREMIYQLASAWGVAVRVNGRQE